MSTNTAEQEKAYYLSDLINYYELCNRAEGRSLKTLTWYTSNLAQFHSYLKSRHLPDSIEHTDTELLREYVLYLLRRHRFENHPYTSAKPEPLSSSTIHGHVRTLRAFFSWLVREGSMVLLDTGLRMGELINLKMDDVHINDGLLKVMGKGKKERIVPVVSNAQRALQRYLFRYRPKPFGTSVQNVFLSVLRKPLTENSVKLLFSRLAKKSGVIRLHAHLCRHTFATRFLINGSDVFPLQQILGHSTLEMVRHYVNLASNHIVIQHQKFSPLDRLDLQR